MSCVAVEGNEIVNLVVTFHSQISAIQYHRAFNWAALSYETELDMKDCHRQSITYLTLLLLVFEKFVAQMRGCIVVSTLSETTVGVTTWI